MLKALRIFVTALSVATFCAAAEAQQSPKAGSTNIDSGAIMTAEEESNYELLLELTAGFNAHDLDRIMSHFAEDASLDMPRGSKPWGTRFIGKDAVRKGLAMRFESTPDVHYGEARHWVSGRLGVSEWLLTGTTKDGRKVEVRGNDHYEFQGGKVIRKDSYWKIVE
jgi:ketosteroid isomerase-like protein